MSDIRREPFSSDADILSARLAAGSRSAPKSPTEALQPEPVPPPPARSQAARHPAVVVLNFALTIAIVAVVAIGAALFIGRSQFEKPGSFDQDRTVTIQPGEGLSTIAEQLQKNGLISSKWLFIAGVWLSRQENAMKAGEYQIPARSSMQAIMETMITGKGILYAVTIPEGLTSLQIVDRLNSDPVLEGDPVAAPPEGSLLPETYKFTRGDTRQSLVARMQRERDHLVDNIWQRRAPDLPLKSKEELVVLASVVEKETALADERSRVAAVFINRLRQNMRLQSDPTVVYGLFAGKGKPAAYTLSRADLDSTSPYNTYVVDGLPPGPIANPGRASLEAVANPSHTRDLFFVADGTGGHAFAETYEEHLRNVARWRKVNADGGAAADSPPAPEPAAGGTDNGGDDSVSAGAGPAKPVKPVKPPPPKPVQ